ncbi:MAG: hypothetical protein ACP5NZ_01730 [Nanobdellota archaeon]
MKKFDYWRLFNTMVIVAILIIAILILKKVNRCCDCNEKSNSQQETILTLRDAGIVYDTLNHRKGTLVLMDTLMIGQQRQTSLIIWNDCPEKPVKKVPKPPKKNLPVTTKVKEVTNINVNVAPKEEIVKRDTCLQLSPCNPDTLKIEVQSITPKSTSLLYKNSSVLPSCFTKDGNKSEFNYDVIPDLHLTDYTRKAKTHLIIGTTAALAGTITYASTWFSEIPTFVEYNGLQPFDPANKYYDRNMLSKQHLNTLKTVRAVGIGLGALGGLEIIHGIILLKPAELDITPQRISLKYSF